jgi:hypothetical protein
MNSATCFVCDDCQKELDLHEPVNLCPYCGGLLEVRYDREKVKRSAHLFKTYVRDSIWRYRDLFPPVSEENIVSLGEGGAPLIKSEYLSGKLGIENLYFKNDCLMPTGSIKTAWRGPLDLTPIGLAVQTHLGLASPNFGIQEYYGYSEATNEIFPGAPVYRDGALWINEEPGHGVAFDERRRPSSRPTPSPPGGQRCVCPMGRCTSPDQDSHPALGWLFEV